MQFVISVEVMSEGFYFFLFTFDAFILMFFIIFKTSGKIIFSKKRNVDKLNQINKRVKEVVLAKKSLRKIQYNTKLP